MSEPGAAGHDSRRTWLAFGLILVLAVLVRILSFRGYTTYDAAEYTRLAHMMVAGGFKVGMVWFFRVFPVRVGLFAPVALAFKVFGVNELTLTAYPFLLSLLGVLVAYFAARAMFGTRAGLIAAALAALLPLDVRHASQLLPDMPAAFYMNTGMVLVYAGSRHEAVSRKAWLGALGGFALFASWLCKESVLFLLPFLGAYLLWSIDKSRRNLVLLLAVVATAGLLIAVEGWVYHRYTGDFFYRFYALKHNTGAGADRTAIAMTGPGIAHYALHRINEVLHEIILTPYLALIPVAALAACVYAAFRRLRAFLFPGFWFGWLLLLFGFGSSSLKAYFPLSLEVIRYQYPLLFPAVLLVAGFLGTLLSPRDPSELSRRYRRRLLWGATASACLTGMAVAMIVWGFGGGMGRQCRVERQLSRILKPTDRLYTDAHTAIALDFFWKFPKAESTHYFEGMSLAQLPSNVYVLFNWDELDRIRRNTDFVAPEFLDSVPPTWQKVRDNLNATLYWVPSLYLSH